MKRNILLLLILLGLASVFWFLSNRDKGTNQIADRAFTVDNESSIHSFSITKRTGEKSQFKREDGIWKVLYNDEYRKANQLVVQNIMHVLTKAQIDFIPARQATKNIINEINSIGLQIDSYDKNGNLLKSFFVGGNTNDGDGTYFLMQGAVQPYVMTLQAFTGNLRDRFTQKTLEFLTPYYLEVDPATIREVTIDYPLNKSMAFQMTKNAEGYTVKPIYETTSVIDTKVNQKLVDTYLQNFTKLASEYLENDNPKIKNIDEKVAFANVTIELDNGTKQKLVYYPLQYFIDSNTPKIDLENIKKIQRFFCKIDNEDIYLVQQRLVKEIFRPYNYFYL